MSARKRPPRLARWILTLILPPRYRDNQLGDLAEEFRSMESARGVSAAQRWYRRQVLTSLRSNLTLRLREGSFRSKEGGPFMETLWQDINYGIRSLTKSPGYAVISALALALAIGVNTAIFSLVNIVAFQDLPMQDHESLAFVWMTDANTGRSQEGVSFQDLVDLRRGQRSFESLSALSQAGSHEGHAREVAAGRGAPPLSARPQPCQAARRARPR